MKKVEDKKEYEIGCIVGRFQVDEPHEGHIELIESVLEKHKKVILFLGQSTVIGSHRNPLDFQTRKLMFEEYFSKKYSERFIVLPIMDKFNDDLWSSQLDERVREVFPIGGVVLYGSRDSFLPHYTGKFATHELEATTFYSGTEIRKSVSQEVMKNKFWRAGVIYGVSNRHPIMFAQLNIIIRNGTQEVLLGKYPNQEKLHLLEGFLNPEDSSNESAVRGVIHKKLGVVEVSDINYIGSAKIDHWMYRSDDDKVMGMLYSCTYVYGPLKPSDDLTLVKWVKEEDVEELLIDEHKELWNLNINIE